MITFHWAYIPFLAVVGFLVYKIATTDKGRGDYSFDIATPFYILLLVIAIAIFGGIYWW